MSFPQYEKYNDSGVELFGKLPAHWKVGRLKGYLDRNDGGVWGDDPDNDGEAGTIVLRSTEQTVDGRWIIEDPARRKLSPGDRAGALLKTGDLLLTKSSGSSLHIGKTTLVDDEVEKLGCCFSNFMQRLRTKPSLSPRLAWYILNHRLAREQFDLLSNSTTGLANLNARMIGSVVLPVPPLAEQIAIAAILDRETAKIDALVDEQQRLIELLKEKRQTVISHAVTKGIIPNAAMKSSGVDWLGEVPEHWEVTQLRRVARAGTSITYGIVQAGPDIEGGIPYIRTSDMAGDQLPCDGYLRTSREIDAAYARSKVTTGDVVIAIRATIGKPLIVPAFLDGANLTQGTAKFSPGPSVLNEFIFYFLRSSPAIGQFERLGKGATFKEITLEMLRKFAVLQPPLDEQRQIIDLLRSKTAQFDGLISETEKAVSLLQERRSALISAAVTGKIDVRELVKTNVAISDVAAA
ncbi:restriction endonuclease subunit S [Bradyrhizobium sp. CCBAU 53415]|uniref:restriction endonuclease subunit S n=1 Tax=Bradyrhizobium sp. CCBAU 53415 TaxID=1325119 RepID=UPI002304E715|nr:restriction endonuclease subunit S [Bradyrhizobium sp. CCBAU 53415]